LERRAVPGAHRRLLRDGQHDPLRIEGVRQVAHGIPAQRRPPADDLPREQHQDQAGDGPEGAQRRAARLAGGEQEHDAKSGEEQDIEGLGQHDERDEHRGERHDSYPTGTARGGGSGAHVMT